MLSQKATIGLNNTTILDEEKTIDVASIIKNEERLRDYVDELHSDLEALNDSIQKTVLKNTLITKEVRRLLAENEQLQIKIDELTEKELSITPTKHVNGLYGSLTVGSDLRDSTSFIIGLSFVNKKNLFTFGIDPIRNESINKEINYYLGMGFKLF